LLEKYIQNTDGLMAEVFEIKGTKRNRSRFWLKPINWIYQSNLMIGDRRAEDCRCYLSPATSARSRRLFTDLENVIGEGISATSWMIATLWITYC
jgi:hypothetical protein